MATKAQKERALDALYAELPRLDCQQKCQECCGLLAMTGLEFDRLLSTRPGVSHVAARFGRDRETVFFAGPNPDIEKPDSLVCPMLKDGLCTVYQVRPLICRLWGMVEAMRCEHGCVPERWLTDDEAREFNRRVDEIAAS